MVLLKEPGGPMRRLSVSVALIASIFSPTAARVQARCEAVAYTRYGNPRTVCNDSVIIEGESCSAQLTCCAVGWSGRTGSCQATTT
jgi:hypothetical protein